MFAKIMACGVAAACLTLSGCAGHADHGHHHHHHKKFYSRDYVPHKHHHGHHQHIYKRTYYYNNYYGKRVHYPYSYYGTRHAAHVRMSNQSIYGEGYEAGCRTAWTGGMYKNPKLMSNSQSYQMGWETGFKKCQYDRSHAKSEKPKYSYIPY